MNIGRKITLVGGTYKASVSLVELTPTEKEVLARYPEPIVVCGGAFGSGETAFTLPADDRKFPSAFPVTKAWTLTDTAAAQADLWAREVEARIVAAVSELMNQTPGPIGSFQTHYNFPLSP